MSYYSSDGTSPLLTILSVIIQLHQTVAVIVTEQLITHKRKFTHGYHDNCFEFWRALSAN